MSELWQQHDVLVCPSLWQFINLFGLSESRALWGPDVSSMVVREISDAVRSWQRDWDVIGRVGEDQIAILFVGLGPDSGQKIVSKLRDNVGKARDGRMGWPSKITSTSSICAANKMIGFPALQREAFTALARGRRHEASVSFTYGIDVPKDRFFSYRDGDFVNLG